MTNLAKVSEPENLLPADPMISMIERVALDPNSDLEKLERMLAMKERMEAEQAKKDFAQAFAQASVSFPNIPLNGKGHNNKPYALLKDIMSLTRGPLSENGLALSFDIKTGDKITVTAELMHRSGHTKRASIDLPADTSGSKNAVQAIGSSQTYGQRYAAQAVLGLSLGDDIDDDAKSHGSQPVEKHPSWAQTVIQDLPATATERDKAKAIADALIAQWKRKPTKKQLDNEWDRREEIIDRMHNTHPDLWTEVCAAFDQRVHDISEAE